MLYRGIRKIRITKRQKTVGKIYVFEFLVVVKRHRHHLQVARSARYPLSGVVFVDGLVGVLYVDGGKVSYVKLFIVWTSRRRIKRITFYFRHGRGYVDRFQRIAERNAELRNDFESVGERQRRQRRQLVQAVCPHRQIFLVGRVGALKLERSKPDELVKCVGIYVCHRVGYCERQKSRTL